MTEIVALANALRKSTDEFLTTLLKTRQISSSGFRDFLDFATAVGEPKGLKATIAALPRSQARALSALCSGVKPESLDEKTLEKLANQLLVFREVADAGTASYRVSDLVRAAFATFEKTNFADEAEAATGADRSLEAADRDAGVAAFEAMQALTELHFDVDQRYVREVGKRGVGLADLKRLAGHLRKTNDFARAIYALARENHLIAAAEGRWSLGTEADLWLELSPAKRFEALVRTWRTTLGDDSAAELLAMAKLHPDQSLDALFRFTYPLADAQVNSHISSLEATAELIGITAGQSATSWFQPVLEGNFAKAAEMLAEHLPPTSERLIIQADLSLIAPGPLPTLIEIELRKFAETEQISMASTYRLNALSISHGLETGLTEAKIRELLTELSDKELPQPVDYLLREAVGRFGRLQVCEGPGEARSLIKSVDPILLTEILNETRLRPFSIRQNPDGDLFSRFEPEVIYFGLREAGFSAIRVDAAGRVISPRTLPTRTSTMAIITTVANDIERLREHDAKLGSEPEGDDLVRQIEFALKNKAKLLIMATDRSGAKHEFLIEPRNLSNGRLRGIDTRAEIERTIPLERITGASPVAD